MLSFELNETGKVIEILCDTEGLALLKSRLDDLQKFDHIHLLTAANGGYELDEKNLYGKPTIGEVIITKCDFAE